LKIVKKAASALDLPDLDIHYDGSQEVNLKATDVEVFRAKFYSWEFTVGIFAFQAKYYLSNA